MCVWMWYQGRKLAFRDGISVDDDALWVSALVVLDVGEDSCLHGLTKTSICTNNFFTIIIFSPYPTSSLCSILHIYTHINNIYNIYNI